MAALRWSEGGGSRSPVALITNACLLPIHNHALQVPPYNNSQCIGGIQSLSETFKHSLHHSPVPTPGPQCTSVYPGRQPSTIIH